MIYFPLFPAHKCRFCERTSRKRGPVANHERIHWSYWKSLHGERETNEMYECFECKKLFDKLFDLYNHMRPFKCPICDCSYRNVTNLISHKRKHSKLVYDCEYCNKSFGRIPHLKRHIETTHENDLKTYKCNHCPEISQSRILLDIHSIVHDNTSEQLCPECGKVFQNKSLLKMHLQMHSSDYPFECKFCPKKFKVKSSLKIHLPLHTREYRFSCDICDKTFLYNGSLQAHKCEFRCRLIKTVLK